MYTKTIGILAVLFMIVGCTGGGAAPGAVGHAALEGPELGIAADPELRVVSLIPESAAEKAGVQIGDILVDLTWIPTDEAPPNPGFQLSDTADPIEVVTTNEDGTTITTYVPVTIVIPVSVSPLPTPRARPSDHMPKDPVPLTNIIEAISLVGSGYPLNLRVIRNGEEVTIEITPTVRVRNYGPDNPVPTPMPDDWYGY